MEKTHYYLLMKEKYGSIAVGVVGVALFIVLLTGIYLWYPGIKRMFKSLKLKWNNGKMARNYSLHNLIGVLTLPVLIIVAVTGALFEFQWKVEQKLNLKPATQYPSEKIVSIDNGEQPLSLSNFIQIAKKQHQKGTILGVSIPPEKNSLVEVYIKDGYDPGGYGNITEYYDQYTGKNLWTYSPQKRTTYDSFNDWKWALHYGHYGGILTRVIYAFVGLSPVLLGVTGVTMWLIKRRKSKQKQKKNYNLAANL